MECGVTAMGRLTVVLSTTSLGGGVTIDSSPNLSQTTPWVGSAKRELSEARLASQVCVCVCVCV